MTKRILITGKNSYIGNQLADWLNKEPQKYTIVKESVRDDKWKEIDFSVFDAVVHVAGIAHMKETSKNEEIYYKVNRDLAYEIAKESKKFGVKQFVFFSTMSVYGIDNGVIDINTPPNPTNAYGKSKLEAEISINKLADESFTIAILRPPMVYGKGCRGNYRRLAKLALKTPIFPSFNNKRSMIHINNLSELVRYLISNNSGGLFYPQNKEYVNTSQMVNVIAQIHGKKIRNTRLFTPLLKWLNTRTLNKVFGDLIYEKSMSEYKYEYRLTNFYNSILITEE